METILHYLNPTWAQYPWKHFSSPLERFEVLPTFVIGEFVFISLAIVLLRHAVQQGRCHVMMWVAALIAGTANDAFFMALPMVDNFWQAQACIMLTPRMPLYIPCVYIVFLYSSAVGAWRIGGGSGFLGVLGVAALAGIMAEMIYAPYDITGAKFIWWTWHDTDASVRDRLLGAPVGSSSWVMTFGCSFQVLLQLVVPEKAIKGLETLSMSRFLACILVCALLSTPLMLVQMSLFQLMSFDYQGLPTVYRTFAAIVVVYLAVTLVNVPLSPRERTNRLCSRRQSADDLMAYLLVAYFVYLFVNMYLGRPEAHRSAGVHQTVGPCGIQAKDISGHLRQKYLCQEGYDEDWSLNCGEDTSGEQQPLKNYSEWYTICGKPHSAFELYVGILGALAALGITTYIKAFLIPKRKLDSRVEDIINRLVSTDSRQNA